MDSSVEHSNKRQFRSKGERRRIVEEALRPGASVARVARANGVNANQVFTWRRLYLKGLLGEKPSNSLLPVKICDSPVKRAVVKRTAPPKTAAGVIDIDLGHARVRIEGAADPDCVRAALERLIR